MDGDWPYTMDSQYCESRVQDDEDDPLRGAGVFTHKEVLKRQIAALEREKAALFDFHVLLGEKLRRLSVQHEKQVRSSKKKKKPLKIELDEQERKYLEAQTKALAKYGSHINWKSVQDFLGKCDEKKKIMSNPKIIKTERPLKIPSSMQRIPGCCAHMDLIKIEKAGEENEIKIEHEERRFCSNNVLPLAEFCSAHILEDVNQIIYGKCAEEGCENICFVFENACNQHGKSKNV